MASNSKSAESLDGIESKTWQSRIHVEVRLSPSESRNFDKSDTYLISIPRLSYLPFLLPRLLIYYSNDLIEDANTVSVDTGFFTFEGVLLKWHLPIGLLYDIHVLSTQDVHRESSDSTWAPNPRIEPFKLTVHFSQDSSVAKTSSLINPSPPVVHDAFINSVKEADFLRSGSAKPIMSLSAADSKLLWSSTQENDLKTFSRIHAGLLPTNTPWRNIPLRIYLPSTSVEGNGNLESDTRDSEDVSLSQAQIRVVQSQIPPYLTTTSSTTPSQLRSPNVGQVNRQTVGTALHTLLPSLFPSRRTPILAKPLLHGAVIPMNAILEEVASRACYADGWVNIVIAISG